MTDWHESDGEIPGLNEGGGFRDFVENFLGAELSPFQAEIVEALAAPAATADEPDITKIKRAVLRAVRAQRMVAAIAMHRRDRAELLYHARATKRPPWTSVERIAGIDIRINPYLPEGTAAMIGSDGSVIALVRLGH